MTIAELAGLVRRVGTDSSSAPPDTSFNKLLKEIELIVTQPLQIDR